MATILQVNFRWDLPPDEQERHASLDAAREIADVAGLQSSDVDIRHFDVRGEHSAITRAPIGELVA